VMLGVIGEVRAADREREQYYPPSGQGGFYFPAYRRWYPKG